MHPFLRYSLLRLGLLATTGIVLYALGVGGLLLLVLAFVVSGFISLVVLDRQRAELGTRVGGYFRRLNSRIESSTTAEDDELGPRDVQPTDVVASDGADAGRAPVDDPSGELLRPTVDEADEPTRSDRP